MIKFFLAELALLFCMYNAYTIGKINRVNWVTIGLSTANILAIIGLTFDLFRLYVK